MFKTRQEMHDYWNDQAKKILVGRRIIAAGYAPDPDPNVGLVLTIVLDNKTKLWVMSDDEGNGPGALHTSVKSCRILPHVS